MRYILLLVSFFLTIILSSLSLAQVPPDWSSCGGVGSLQCNQCFEPSVCPADAEYRGCFAHTSEVSQCGFRYDNPCEGNTEWDYTLSMCVPIPCETGSLSEDCRVTCPATSCSSVGYVGFGQACPADIDCPDPDDGSGGGGGDDGSGGGGGDDGSGGGGGDDGSGGGGGDDGSGGGGGDDGSGGGGGDDGSGGGGGDDGSGGGGGSDGGSDDGSSGGGTGICDIDPTSPSCTDTNFCPDSAIQVHPTCGCDLTCIDNSSCPSGQLYDPTAGQCVVPPSCAPDYTLIGLTCVPDSIPDPDPDPDPDSGGGGSDGGGSGGGGSGGGDGGSDGGGSGGGGTGGGDSDGDESSVSGGEDCLTDPVCDGDVIACANLHQQWKTRCKIEHSEEDLTTFKDGLTEPDTNSSGVLDELIKDPVDVSGMVDFSGDISGAESRSGSCPNPASVGTHVGSADVSYEFICQFAELIRPIVILGFGFMGSFLAVRTILSS